MPDSVPYLLPQHRFPNRLDKLRRAAVEIALSEGEFAPAGERGCAIEALFGGFRIRYFSPFQHRTNWKPADWDNKRVAFCVHRLLILRHGPFLSLSWRAPASVLPEPKYPELDVKIFFDPSKSHWDQQLRERWDSFKARKAKSEKQMPVAVQLRQKRFD
jgi:hypothetical protein